MQPINSRVDIDILTSHYFEQKLTENGIVPDVIEQAPSSLVCVIYPEDKHVELGNELTPTQVKDPPNVNWDADPQSFYTLIKVDPDAPSRDKPQLRNADHWLVVNIPGCDVSKGEVIVEYLGAGPPQGTGLHRYVFLVYKQNGKIQFNEQKVSKTSIKSRILFSVGNFAEKYALGQPIAANFYEAQWDEYVEILQKNFEDLEM